MATAEEVRQELAKAETQLEKAEAAVTAFEGRYKSRLTWLEDKLWSEEGTEAQRAEWKEEKTKLEEEKMRLDESKTYWEKQVGEWGKKLRELEAQPGNDFVTRALGT